MKIIPGILISLIAFSGWAQSTVDPFSPSFFEKQRFAHRGGYANGPENTLKTILFSLEQGAKALEIDVRLTSDNHLVLFHDPKVQRVLQVDQEIAVRDLTLRELQSFPLRDSRQGRQYVSTLAELVDTLATIIPRAGYSHFLLEIDFKPNGDQTSAAVNELINILEIYKEKMGQDLYEYFFVSTFYPEVLREIRKRDKKMKLAFAINPYSKDNKIKARLAAKMAPYIMKKYRVEIIEPHMCMVTPGFVKKWKRKNILINAWTANTRCAKDYLELLGIAYTTNCPESYCETEESDHTSVAVNWCRECLR